MEYILQINIYNSHIIKIMSLETPQLPYDLLHQLDSNSSVEVVSLYSNWKIRSPKLP